MDKSEWRSRRLSTRNSKSMNRIFAIMGFLAAGMDMVWVWFVICLPWFPFFSSDHRTPPSLWLLWVAVCVLGLAVIALFLRLSLTAHWAALRRNASISRAAWRGICGIYLLVMLLFALPVLSPDPSGSHRVEEYGYGCLAGMALALSIVALRRGFGRTSDFPIK